MLPLLLVALAAGCAEEGVCLLQLRHAQAEVSAGSLLEVSARRLATRHAELRDWTDSTSRLRNELRAHARNMRLHHHQRKQGPKAALSEGNLDAFVANQKDSDDACHAKQLEAKRTLDGILKQVETLTDEIEASTEVIEAETGVLADATEKKKDAVDAQAAEHATCADKAKERADAEHAQVNAELEELQQMANPEVRSKVALHETYGQAMKEIAAEVKREALLAQTGSNRSKFTALCKAHVGFLQKALSRMTAAAVPPPKENQCDEMRDDLQETFTDTYTELTELHEKKDKELTDEKAVCVDLANDKFKEKEVLHETEVKRASDAIAEAKSSIEQSDPMLQDQKQTAEKMRAHIAELKETCVVSEDVTVYVEKVRDLIDKLEDCPGRNDFWLRVPEWTPESAAKTKAAAPGGAATTTLGASAPAQPGAPKVPLQR